MAFRAPLPAPPVSNEENPSAINNDILQARASLVEYMSAEEKQAARVLLKTFISNTIGFKIYKLYQKCHPIILEYYLLHAQMIREQVEINKKIQTLQDAIHYT